MSKFSVGDRVAVYTGTEICEQPSRITGTVAKNNGNEPRIYVEPDSKSIQPHFYHSKQCRRLVKPKPRRRIFVWKGNTAIFGKDGAVLDTYANANNSVIPTTEYVEFVEVRRKKARQ